MFHSLSGHGGSAMIDPANHRVDIFARLARVIQVALSAAQHHRRNANRAEALRRHAGDRGPGVGKKDAAQRCIVSMKRAGSWLRNRARLPGLRLMTSAHPEAQRPPPSRPVGGECRWRAIGLTSDASPIGPPLIQKMNSFDTTSGWRSAVSRDTREPAEPPTSSAGAMPSARSSPARVLALSLDSRFRVEAHIGAPRNWDDPISGPACRPWRALRRARARPASPSRSVRPV